MAIWIEQDPYSAPIDRIRWLLCQFTDRLARKQWAWTQIDPTKTASH